MKPSLLFTLSVLYTILRLEPSALAATKIWTSIGPDGGHVQAIAIDPQASDTIYVVAGGAIFKSTDGAAHWKRVYSPATSDGVANPAIVVGINPQDSNTVYAGATNGLFKSTDGGASWFAASTGLTGNRVDASGNQSVVSLGVSSVAIDPQDSNTLYAAANGPAQGGISKSTDGGAHWSPSSSGLAVVALAVDPRNPNTVYAAGDGTFKSKDGGACNRLDPGFKVLFP